MINISGRRECFFDDYLIDTKKTTASFLLHSPTRKELVMEFNMPWEGDGKRVQPDPYKWSKSSIAKILANQEYCGDIINFKTYSKSFKNKTRLDNPEENWVIFKNVHEPIIDRETFGQVQKMVGKTKRRAPKAENGEKNMFADLLYWRQRDSSPVS